MTVRTDRVRTRLPEHLFDRVQAHRRDESSVTAEVFMNNAG